ncbi:MAG: CtsR family transcriptional regulator [Acidobacteriota bacterium]
MRSLSDRIEQYIRVLIERSEQNEVEIQRVELAETFNCVPSQITYVLSTRFTPTEGYRTESRRGGKGFLRICKLESDFYVDTISFSMEQADAILEELARKELLSVKELDQIKRLMDHYQAAGDVVRAAVMETIKILLEGKKNVL